MGPTCIVCQLRKKPGDRNCSFYKWPTDADRSSKWLKSLGMREEELVNKKNITVCSNHFRNDDFELHGHDQIKMLTPLAVPKRTLQEGNEKAPDIASEIKEEIKIEEHKLIDNSGSYGGRIKCPQCTYMTKSDYHLKSHVCMHENDVKCDVCGKTDNLTRPLFPPYNVCSQCKKDKTLNELRVILANKALDFNKKVPGTSGRKMKAEYLLQNAGLSTIVICDDDEEPLKEYIGNDVQESETGCTWKVTAGTYKCKFCPYKSSKFHFLLKHQSNKHHDTTYISYNCVLCDFVTSQFISLLKHKKRMHSKIHCSLCAFTTNSVELFRSHMWEHENHENCDICGRNEYLTFTFLSRQVCTQCKKGKTEAELRGLLASLKPENNLEVFLAEDGRSNSNVKSQTNLSTLTSIDLSDDSSDCASSNMSANNPQSGGNLLTQSMPYINTGNMILLTNFNDSDMFQSQDKDHYFSNLEESGPFTFVPPLLNRKVDNGNEISDLTDDFHAQYVKFSNSQPNKMKPSSDINNVLSSTFQSGFQQHSDGLKLTPVQPIKPTNPMPPKEAEFVCTTCGFKTDIYMSFRKHTLEANTYVCYDFCPRTFTCLSSLSKHLLEQHTFKMPERCDTFKCSFCCYSSILEPKVLNHQRFIHPISAKEQTSIPQKYNSANKRKKQNSEIPINGKTDRDILFVNVSNALNESHFEAEGEEPEIILIDDDEDVEIVSVNNINEANESLAVLDKIADKYKRVEKLNKRFKNNLFKPTVVE